MRTSPATRPDTKCCDDDGLIRVFSLLGKRWSGLVLNALMDGPVRFAELGRSVAGISESMLSQRLGELIDAGLVQREIAAYRLTESGMALHPALEELARWAAIHLEARAGHSSA
jgi:DNA-binding HxlR family transcriptional regulator